MPEYIPIRLNEEVVEMIDKERLIELEEAKKNENMEKIAMLSSMGTGAFGGYLVFKMMNENGHIIR